MNNNFFLSNKISASNASNALLKQRASALEAQNIAFKNALNARAQADALMQMQTRFAVASTNNLVDTHKSSSVQARSGINFNKLMTNMNNNKK